MLHIVGECEKRIFGLRPAERLTRQLRSRKDVDLVAHASAVMDDAALDWLIETTAVHRLCEHGERQVDRSLLDALADATLDRAERDMFAHPALQCVVCNSEMVRDENGGVEAKPVSFARKPAAGVWRSTGGGPNFTRPSLPMWISVMLAENEAFIWSLADAQIDEFLPTGRCEVVRERDFKTIGLQTFDVSMTHTSRERCVRFGTTLRSPKSKALARLAWPGLCGVPQGRCGPAAPPCRPRPIVRSGRR